MLLSPNNFTSSQVFEAKQVIRARCRAMRKSLSSESRMLLDSALFANTISLPCFQNSDTVLMYYPVQGEPNILSIARHALQMNKKVAFPISHTNSYTMSFHLISDIDDLRIGAYSILEPPISAPTVCDFSKALCIVPALAFDMFGHRLGYGKGYYDRFLSEFNGTSIGLTYSFFLMDLLPHGEKDLPVNLIITEKGDLTPYETTNQ